MSDFLDGFIHHTQPNFQGGEDFFAASGMKVGHTAQNFQGGHDVYAASGLKTAYTTSNVHGGHDLHDVTGIKLGYTVPNVFHGHAIHGAHGTHLGDVVPHGVGGADFHVGGMKVAAFHPSVGGGMDVHHAYHDWSHGLGLGTGTDPLSGLSRLTFPSMY